MERRPERESMEQSPFLRGTPPRQRARRTLACAGVVALLLLVLAPFFGDNGLATLLKLRSERDLLREEVEGLEQQRRTLGEGLDELRNDPTVLEECARERFRMQKEGEKVYEVIEENPDEG